MTTSKVTILDAGMGRTLSMKGVDIPPTIWSANALLVAPEVVVEVHRENISAGADIITTNSYGIIRKDLAKEDIEDQYTQLNELAGSLAQTAVKESGANVLIAGSLPPQNGSYRPDLVLDEAVIRPLYEEQAESLSDYVDLFICETMSTIKEAVAACSAALQSSKPVIVGLTLHDDEKLCLKSGEPLTDAISALQQLGVTGIVANCCLPERISDAMPELVKADVNFTGGYANAFTQIPSDWLLDGEKGTDGRLVLREDLAPDRYCHFVEDWINQGANFVGGCCGTTALHIREIRDFLASKSA
ncbi:MAG: homocysteine S-methyltransferase [Gammaproteobacteria bacterium]|nr:homocysteine S-methyltransferase [Gammaproteobacteria bacterium]|tara:strand:- start:2440 stop:3345 length:906 start_codon:yes stop_codon:yes gene_type:complete